MMFIVGISLLSLELQSIVAHVHKCTYVRTIWTVPLGWGREEGNVQSGLIRMLHVWWEERSSSFPNADPTSHAGSAARQGPLPPNPPFLLGDSPGLLSVMVSSTPHPRGPHGVGTRCFKPHRSVREMERGESDISPESGTLSFLSVCHCLSQPSLVCASSPSFLRINSVNWSALSVLHWLWPLIKEILIGSLFNIGLRTAHCPLMLFLQQPFPVSSTS